MYKECAKDVNIFLRGPTVATINPYRDFSDFYLTQQFMAVSRGSFISELSRRQQQVSVNRLATMDNVEKNSK
jgi:hypothetical protein